MEHGEGGYLELDVYELERTPDGAALIPPMDVRVPLVDPRIMVEFEKGRETVTVSVWMHDEPHQPLFLELQRQVLRGDVRTVAERSKLHERLMSDRRAQIGSIQAPLLELLADNDIPAVYRCASVPCVYTQLTRQSLAILERAPNLAGLTLEESAAEREAPFGVIIGEASQLQFYVDAGWVGEGPTTATSDDVVVTILEIGAPNEEHVGFKDSSSGASPRFKERAFCTAVLGVPFCSAATSFGEGIEDNHATGVTNIILGDLLQGQDPTVTAANWQREYTGYAREARANVIVSGPYMDTALDYIAAGTFTTQGSVLNLSAGDAVADPTCTGWATTSALNSMMDAVYEDGTLPIKSAGNQPQSTTNCTVTAPGAAVGAFTVGAYGSFGGTPDTVAAWRTAPIWISSASGGNAVEGNSRSIIDIAAPVWRGGLYDVGGTYTYNQAGTSFAAAHVSALAIDLIDWDQLRPGAQDWLNFNPGLLHATLLLMGDRQGQSGPILAGGDSLYGVGRLRARAFTGAGMDEPWYFGYGTTCVSDGDSVAVPVNFTPIGDINVLKAAIYWYAPLSAFNQVVANINLRLWRYHQAKRVADKRIRVPCGTPGEWGL